MVRAKFRVDSIERNSWRHDGKEVQTVKLAVVTSGSDENKAFWAASPGGQITLSSVNPEAIAQLELGSEVYVDFTPAK